MSDQPSPASHGADPRARLRLLLIRALCLVLGLAVIIALVWWHVSGQEGDLQAVIQDIVTTAQDSPLAWTATVAVLTVLNIAGLPLILLTVGTAIVFQIAWVAFLFAWTASMIGASLGFGLGRYGGSEMARRFGGERLNAVSGWVGRRGILACFLIRLVPTLPAIMVNVAIGASRVAFWKFFLGTGLGTAPKLALTAWLSVQAIRAGQDGGVAANPMLFTAMAVIIILWFGTLYGVRLALRRWGNGVFNDKKPGEGPGEGQDGQTGPKA